MTAPCYLKIMTIFIASSRIIYQQFYFIFRIPNTTQRQRLLRHQHDVRSEFHLTQKNHHPKEELLRLHLRLWLKV